MKYNIIFIGTPDFSVPTLQALIADGRFNVAAVITAPDAKAGRKQILTPPPVKVLAEKHGIPVLQPVRIKSLPLALRERGLGVRADAIITIAYGQILPEKILQMPKHGCLNLHASLLPKYRGASPIQTAIALGDKETGVTLIKMNEGVDTGDIIAQESVQIEQKETGESLHDKLSKLSAEVAIKYIPSYLESDLKPQPQDDARATYAPKLGRESGRIDWDEPAAKIERLARAYYPWPGTYTLWNKKILKIIAASDITEVNRHKSGTVFLHENKLAVQCGQNSLIINELQLSGGKKMTGKKFLTGHKDIINSIIQ